jgi:hypothetical protein
MTLSTTADWKRNVPLVERTTGRRVRCVAVSQAFAKSKLTPDAQATLLQESFAHASQLGWLCPLANMELPDLVM